MTAPSNFHEVPPPHSSVSGTNTNDVGSQKPSSVAGKWRPRGTPVAEPPVSTLSRFANRLIDRLTGRAFSADELLAKCTAVIAHTAYVKSGASGLQEIGDSTAPFPTIRAALNAFPAGDTAPRNIVLLNSFIGEHFPFTPLQGDPSFYIEAANRASRVLYMDLASTAPAAVIALSGFAFGAYLRISGNQTVGLSLPNLADFAGMEVAIDVEGLASLTVAGEGVTEGDGPAALTITARHCRNVFVDLIGTLNGGNHSAGIFSLILMNCGSNDSAISISGNAGWGYFSDSWVTIVGGIYRVLSVLDSAGGISAGGAGYAQQYSTPLYADQGGNYDHTFW